MAQKRMFSLQIVGTDKFCDMPTSAQCLYFRLGLHGDDDGFVANPNRELKERLEAMPYEEDTDGERLD